MRWRIRLEVTTRDAPSALTTRQTVSTRFRTLPPGQTVTPRHLAIPKLRIEDENDKTDADAQGKNQHHAQCICQRRDSARFDLCQRQRIKVASSLASLVERVVQQAILTSYVMCS
jgi:hypothetical protein